MPALPSATRTKRTPNPGASVGEGSGNVPCGVAVAVTDDVGVVVDVATAPDGGAYFTSHPSAVSPPMPVHPAVANPPSGADVTAWNMLLMELLFTTV